VASVKYRKDDLALDCGKEAKIGTKDGRLLDFQVDCQADLRTLTVTLSRGNTFAISAAGDVEIEINHEKAKIEYSGDEPARIEIKGLMFKR
jgi:hypothetical protein